MEIIDVSKILDHLHANNILHTAQYGFLKYHSTTTNLLECYNEWSVCIQDKNQTAVTYIDFHKAFDVVAHTKLMLRLSHYGIRGSVLEWLKKTF